MGEEAGELVRPLCRLAAHREFLSTWSPFFSFQNVLFCVLIEI